MKKVCGKGVNNLGWSSNHYVDSAYHVKVYNLWKLMLHRCYDPKYLAREPSYRGCRVCSRWLVLSRFAKDIVKLPGYNQWVNNSRFELDKDIRLGHHKVYDPAHCMFVSKGRNTSEMNHRTKAKWVYVVYPTKVLAFKGQPTLAKHYNIPVCVVKSWLAKGKGHASTYKKFGIVNVFR